MNKKHAGPVTPYCAAICLELRNPNPDIWPFELKIDKTVPWGALALMFFYTFLFVTFWQTGGRALPVMQVVQKTGIAKE